MRSLILGIALALVLTGYAADALAAELDPGADVASIRNWLVENNPRLRALQTEAEAADAMIYPAGALPDPMAKVEWQGIDPDHPNVLPANVGATDYMLQQRFPLWGKRELAREVAREQARASAYEHDAVALDLLADAEDAYVRYWHAREAIAVIDRLIGLLEQVEEIAGVRYALGMAAQQDSIRAQVERTSMQRQRIERQALRRVAVSTLNTLLGRRADAPLAEPEAPPALAVGQSLFEATRQRIATGNHPALQASSALATAANRRAELERRNRFPDVTLGVGAMQVGSRVDSYSLMLEVEIPFQQRARRGRERASRLLEEAALTRTDAARDELEGRLGSVWGRWQGAREQRELIEQTLLPQSEANFQSALASYQVGEVDFATLLEALREWQGADLLRVDATRDELLAAAAVRAISGDTQ
ncbi:Heavy metal RND efflux outer membrane protein, CzcC family [Lysobacter sp. A03]|nr:Heavy metal RND efflux outer membrane protein, CzcC family [Lysobacter sp. A03]